MRRFFWLAAASEHFALCLVMGALPFFQLAVGLGDALCGGALPPFFCFFVVFFDAEAFAVEAAQLVLRLRVSLCGGFFVPLRGAAVVLFDALAGFVHEAELVLGVGVALFCRLLEAGGRLLRGVGEVIDGAAVAGVVLLQAVVLAAGEVGLVPSVVVVFVGDGVNPEVARAGNGFVCHRQFRCGVALDPDEALVVVV